MNKTIDEKSIKPYLVTLKVNSKKSEASVKVVKDGKRYNLVGNFKLKKPQIVRFSGQVGATASKVKSKDYYQLQIPYQMHWSPINQRKVYVML